ncbi:hypothetical protein F2Q70_00043841 [Brassica cretica]|uniref:Rotamase n=1 Tax=Brassica cretica TaxID=69181 RepID=A0A8S9KHT7_BRACR|nr:hypothetical protein F2Q70_00043841 [Brassica cretica]
MDAAEQNHLLPKKKESETEDDKRELVESSGETWRRLRMVIRTLDGVVVESTRSECGGRGLPIRDVLGKSKMILGLLEGIPTMHKGETAMVTLETFVKIRSCPCKL